MNNTTTFWIYLLILVATPAFINAQSLNLFGLWFDVNENTVDTIISYNYYYYENDTIFEPDLSAGTQNFVQLNTQTGLIETVSILDDVSAINFNSSTFNQANRAFSFLGRNSNNEDKIFTVDAATGYYIDYPVLADLPLELNFDLRNGINYGFEAIDTEIGYDEETGEPIFNREIFLAAFDAVTGSTTLIGEIDSLEAIYIDGSTINSNDGLFYFIGKDITNATYLYTVLLEDASIVQQAVINNDVNYLGLVYDNQNEKLLAIHLNDKQLVEIDASTAIHTPVTGFVFPNGVVDVFLGGTPLFDQATSTYLFVARYENAEAFRLISINTTTGNLIFDPLLDETVIELQVDNSNFARRFYNEPAACEQPPSVGIFNCE